MNLNLYGTWSNYFRFRQSIQIVKVRKPGPHLQELYDYLSGSYPDGKFPRMPNYILVEEDKPKYSPILGLANELVEAIGAELGEEAKSEAQERLDTYRAWRIMVGDKLSRS